MSRCAYLFHPSIQLIKFTVSGSALQITSAGFQFLLHDPHAQLWDLLLEYLHMAEVKHHGYCTGGTMLFMIQQERRMDVVEVLSFLFMLSTMELGKVCRSF